jgi:signal transduction histidine kinase
MYRRLIIFSVIIIAALCGMGWLGYHSIRIWAQGLEGARLGEFAAVAEQIRQDVKRKLDEFIQTEQQRPYSDYQYYYVPENVAPTQQQQMPLLRSPLGSGINNDLAYGNFQIEPDGTIVTPYYLEGHTDQKAELAEKAKIHVDNIKMNLLPVLEGAAGSLKFPAAGSRIVYEDKSEPKDFRPVDMEKEEAGRKKMAKTMPEDSKQYRIESLQAESQKEQIIKQQRSVVASNIAQSRELLNQQLTSDEVQYRSLRRDKAGLSGQMAQEEMLEQPAQVQELQHVDAMMFSTPQSEAETAADEWKSGADDSLRSVQQQEQGDVVEIKIEPFVPLVVPDANARESVFGGQVFLLRHVQIEDKHFLQGFQLNEDKLLKDVEESASQFMRKGMSFELSKAADDNADRDVAYPAVLDFGFGELMLNLIEIDPGWIDKQISHLRNWFLGIMAIVLVAVTLGLGSLWRNARAQIKLAQKKDDFISAVSHELRTPLTSIRMYSEMLEKNWVKSEDKLVEYYGNMRQESERLSRLIENVLDFSRIQKGRKRYTFTVGDINKCITDVVEMMSPYAAQRGFSIKTELGELEQSAFDSDAVTQIVVNLLDNAIKYARDAEDKTITVRTKSDDKFVIIEVEDHGPGVPHRQHKKIFEQFYRCGSESTRETAGTGLGLALVKKFAEAHNGFVEITNAKPSGAKFTVALARIQN